MSAVLRPTAANLLLMLMALALACALVIDLVARRREPGAETRLAAPPAAAGEADGAAGIEAFRSVIERPLFAPSRRPASQAATIVGAPPVAPPSLELVGVVTAGEDAFVLVRQPGGRTQRLAIGQVIGEWQLERIEPDRAGFTRDGSHAIVPLMRRAPAQPMPVSEPWLGQMPAAGK